MPIILASQSPRRRELMTLITPQFICDVSDVDETPQPGLSPAQLAASLAAAKARAVFARRGGDVVIGCDTVVDLDGRVFGKPGGAAETVEMLGALSGKRHFVHTGVCLLGTGLEFTFTESTTVDFSPIPLDELQAYAATSEPYDKAGAYAIQGWAARFIPRIEGCYYNVMGLPVASLYREMRRLKLL